MPTPCTSKGTWEFAYSQNVPLLQHQLRLIALKSFSHPALGWLGRSFIVHTCITPLSWAHTSLTSAFAFVVCLLRDCDCVQYTAGVLFNSPPGQRLSCTR
jgi:hypothetical protein